MTNVHLGAWLADGWFVEKMGRGRPNPVTTSVEEVAGYEQDRARLVYEHLGEFGMGSPDPQPWYTVPQHDGRNIIAAAFGAAYPEWDELSGSFVLPLNAHPWAGLNSVAEVERLSVPDWERNPLVRENRRKWEEFQVLVGAQRAAQAPLNWTEYQWGSHRMSTFPSFLDLGGFLMGSTEFLTVLAADQELAEALLRKCFELSAGYSDAMCRLYNRPRTAWCSLGGDNSCLVSADMYREYAMPFDALVRTKCGNLPRNLHSLAVRRATFTASGVSTRRGNRSLSCRPGPYPGPWRHYGHRCRTRISNSQFTSRRWISNEKLQIASRHWSGSSPRHWGSVT